MVRPLRRIGWGSLVVVGAIAYWSLALGLGRWSLEVFTVGRGAPTSYQSDEGDSPEPIAVHILSSSEFDVVLAPFVADVEADATGDDGLISVVPLP